MVRAGVGAGKTLGVVGIGGLGHLAIQFGVALGADTYALTHSASKVDDAKKLGAKDVIVTTEEGWADKWAGKFDFILNSSDASFDLAPYLSTLKVNGEFHFVGLADEPLAELKAMTFVSNGAKIAGSHLGNHQEMDAMLKLAAEKGVRPMVETIQVGEEGCSEAVSRVKEGKVRYRFTLTGFDKVFGKK